jgi:hypothetical protein
MKLRIAVVAVVALLVVSWLVLLVLTRNPWPSNDGLVVILVTAMAAIGLVITSRQPRNAVGWLFVATAIVGLLDTVVREYLVLDYRQHGGALPLGLVAAAFRVGTAIFPFLVVLPSILLFPEGRVPSRRWRRALVVYVVLATAFTVTQFAGAGAGVGRTTVSIDIRGNLPNFDAGIVADLAWLITPLFLAFWLASVVHQARCWRRADGERREQLKWLAAGGAICVVSSVALVMFGDGASVSARIVGDVALIGIASCDWRRHPQVPALRDRPPDQPHPVVCDRHQCSRSGLRGRRGPLDAGAAVLLAGGRNGIDARRGRPVQSAPITRSARRRPPVQPEPVRRRGGRRGAGTRAARRR